LAVPVPLAKGVPGEGYPWDWGVHQWLRGENPAVGYRGELRRVAVDLAGFITALQRVDPAGGPLAATENLRGMPLAVRDASTRAAIAAARAFVDADADAATVAWEAALQAPEWDGAPVWFHGDLLPGNLLLEDGQLRAVIDFSGLGVGDPACDLMSAWGLFTGESREVFRSAVALDDATWVRARGHALSQALMFIPYYWETNPLGVKRAQRAVDEILAEHSRNS
jgi:aminoglycoside phosphotransferase (APT) family kinase protein